MNELIKELITLANNPKSDEVPKEKTFSHVTPDNGKFAPPKISPTTDKTTPR